jgi:hypothetical protein
MKYEITVPVKTTVIYYDIEATSQEEAVKQVLTCIQDGEEMKIVPGEYWEEDINTNVWDIEEREDESA